MISVIQGEIITIRTDSLVVMIGGIGFSIHVPAQLRQESHLGDKIGLFTCLVVREDSLTLYGFSSEEEQIFFDLLLGASGIGPRTALAILSVLNVETIRRAVLSEQPEVLARVPGVGKKTAIKLMLHLQGKVGGRGALEGAPLSDVDGEVMDALTSLGYSIVEAQTAIQSIPKNTPMDVEERLRAALQYFST
jgi:Holliday junction DNA helicase RuvA